MVLVSDIKSLVKGERYIRYFSRTFVLASIVPMENMKYESLSELQGDSKGIYKIKKTQDYEKKTKTKK